RVVVIGGGVGGASVAYHLALLGERDVLLLERADLTSGSTFHSAGLVGQLRADPALTRMNMYSVELYRELEQSEHSPGWVESGGGRGVANDAGEVSCEVVVKCGGMCAAELGRLAGVRSRVVPMSHQYVVTGVLADQVARPLPTLRDPDLLIYFREEVDRL